MIRSFALGSWPCSAGHEQVLHLDGGLAAWKEAGLPVVDHGLSRRSAAASQGGRARRNLAPARRFP